MALHTEDSPKAVGSKDPALSAELQRILDGARQQIEEVFLRSLDSTARAAENAAAKVAEVEREQALINARVQLSAELQGQFDQTLQQTTARMQAEFDERVQKAAGQWDTERIRLQEQLNLWRTYAEAQREMGESRSQSEILSHFLDRAEGFAPNLAVYVAKADGLALWKTRGTAAFPEVVSKETIDPEVYFRTIIVRDKTLAAVCARQPIKTESLDFLSGALSRAIEAFGMRLQNRMLKSATS